MWLSKLAIILITSLSNQEVVKSDTSNVSSIIKKTENAYANKVRYLDSGKVVSTFYNAKIPSGATAIYFKTAYSSLGQFNFEFYRLGLSNSIYIVNRDITNTTRNWWGLNNKTKTYIKLEDALKDAQGVSTLTSTMIATFLFSKTGSLGFNIFHQTENLITLKSELINNVLCYKLSGTYKQGIAIFWIGEGDFLIRKIDIDQPIQDFRYHSEYLIYPYDSSDGTVFQFKPNRTIKL